MKNDTVRIPVLIERMRWENPAKSWGVACGVRLDTNEAITMTGALCGLEDKPQTYVGQWEANDKFGPQLKVSHIAVAESLSNDAVARILTLSPEFKGIGPITAKRLVDAASEKGLAHDIVEGAAQLAFRSGVKAMAVEDIREAWTRLVHGSEEVLFLTGYGLTQKQIAAMQSRYGAAIIQRIQQNPYVLVRGFRSLTFRKVDAVAMSQGMKAKDPRRVRACIIEAFCLMENDGHTVATPAMFQAKCMDLIGSAMNADAERRLLSSTVKELTDSGVLSVVRTGDNRDDAVIGLTSTVASERLIMMLAAESFIVATIDKPELVDIAEAYGLTMDECENVLGHRPTEEQYSAGCVAATYPLMFLVGGAGVGKTFTIRLIGEVFARMDLSVTQAAPTGKAAKRMFEATGQESNTIHRTLKLMPKDDGEAQEIMLAGDGAGLPSFLAVKPVDQRNSDAFTIDESSMMDTYLGGVVASGMKNHARGVFVLDNAQLPPVGAGSPILDLLEMGVVPTVTLTKTHRNTGRLYEGIQGVRNGGIYASPSPEDDFLVTNTADPALIIREAMEFYERHMHGQYANAQVLCPMKKGEAGIFNLNAACQWKRQQLDGEASHQVWPPEGERLFVGDKVLCVKNLYEGEAEDRRMKVQNGSLGLLKEIELNKGGDKVLAYRVLFDGDKELTVLRGMPETSNLTLGYAITVHKSQGSEWPFVFYAHPMGSAPGFLDRRMLYTGVSRAQTQTLCYGPLRGMQSAAALEKGSVRLTSIQPQVFSGVVASMQAARLEDNIKRELELEQDEIMATPF